MVLSIYHITLLKGFLRKTFNIAECTICYESTPLYSFHKGENIHGICRECIGSYNKTVCHMCRTPIPEEILTQWSIWEAVDALQVWNDDSDSDESPAFEEGYIEVSTGGRDFQGWLEDASASSRIMLTHSYLNFQERIVQAMDDLFLQWNTLLLDDFTVIFEDAEYALYNDVYLSYNAAGMAYAVCELIKAHEKYGFSLDYFSSFWERIKNEDYTEQTRSMTIIHDGRSITIEHYFNLRYDFLHIEYKINKIESLLYDIEEEPDMSFEKFTRNINEIDYNVSCIKDKISENYSFSTDDNVVTLYMLINKEYNL